MQLWRNQHRQQVGNVQEPRLPGGQCSQAEDPISKLKMQGCHARLQSYMQVRLACLSWCAAQRSLLVDVEF